MGEVRDEVMNLDFRSIMVLPITFGDELLGSLCLKNARSKDFSQEEINFCTAVARASANALKNALLHRQVKEEAVRHRLTAEKLERILKHSLDLILTTNREGQIMEFNQSAEKLLGYSSDELQGQPCSILFGRDDGVNILDMVDNQSGTFSKPVRQSGQFCSVKGFFLMNQPD